MFGKTISSGKFVSNSAIACIVPPHFPGSVMVKVSINNQDYTFDQLQFTYTTQSTISKISPSVVTTIGSENITVYGTSLTDTAAPCCIFDDIKVPAIQVLNSTAIICQVPPHASGDSYVDISLNGIDTSGMKVPIKYVSMPLINSINPSFGTVLGGTVVHLYGTKIPTSINVVCKFGDVVVMASQDSDSHLSCVSPAQSQGQYLLSVSVNGVYFVSTGLVFEYVPEPTFLVLSPSMGPETGGTDIRIDGVNLGPHGQVTCEFGSAKYRVLGRWNEDSSISCVAPSHAPGQIDVRISTNGQQFSQSAGVFQYSYHETVYKLSPSLSLQSGGVVVTVLGTNFVNSSSLSCKFGSITRFAKYINSSAISCVCPATSGSVRSVYVDVSNNGIDFSNSRIQFSYFEEVQVSDVFPVVGPSFGGSLLHFW